MTEDIAKKNLARVKRLYKKLANAETVTGQEAGLLYSYAFFITCYNTNGNRTDKTPYSAEDFQTILAKIPTQEEWVIYSIYKRLIDVILDGYNYYLERLVSFEKGYNANVHELLLLRMAEDRQRELDNRPLVVTEAQYKRLYQKTLESLQEQKESFYTLFFNVLLAFLAEPDKAPEAVKDAFNVYRQIVIDEDKPTTAFELLHKMKPFKETDTDNRIFFEVFKDRYKVLYTAVFDYLKENLFKITLLNPTKQTDLTEPFIEWELLAEKKIIGFENVLQPTNKSIAVTINLEGGKTKESWSKSQRAYNNGIAIMHEPSPDCVDDNGDYKEPANKLFVPLTIDDKGYKLDDTKEALEYNINELMYARIREVYAFNEVLAILEKTYKIDDLTEAFGIKTGGVEDLAKFYNKTIIAYSNELYGDKAQIQEKQELIKQTFKEIDLQPYHPTAKNIEYVKKVINGVKFNAERFVYRFTRINGLVKMMIKGEQQQ